MCGKILSVVVAVMIAILSLPVSFAEAADLPYYPIETENGYMKYSEYFRANASAGRPSDKITVKGADFTECDGDFRKGKFEDRDGVLVIDGSTAEVSYSFDVTESGNYCISISYFPLESNSNDIELSVKIDNEIPYDISSRLVLNRVWADEKEIYKDLRGNEVRPAQVQRGIWQESFIKDPDGLYSEPLFFNLGSGRHEITFSSSRAEFALGSFTFRNPEKINSYSPPDFSATETNIFRIEGEKALYKSDCTLAPTYDNSSCTASPADPVKVVYNTIGGDNWQKPNQSITWEIPAEKVKDGGYFRIGIKARQNKLRGRYSGRRIYIDGLTPFSELEEIKFPYSNKWSLTVPTTRDGEEIYVFLSGNTAHTITLECVTGETGDAVRRLSDVLDLMNDCYRKIIMITGLNPDKNTDYYVHEKIPDLIENFSHLSAEIKSIKSGLEEISAGSETALLGNMAVILDKCIEKPLRIPEYVSQIKDSTITLSAFMNDFCSQPLELDYIEFASYDSDFSDCSENIFSSAAFGIKSFIGSFFEDYTTISDISGEDAVDVWIAAGRDNAQIVRELTEGDFTEKSGIPVSVSLVSGGIVEAVLSGKEPDCALFLGGEFPVNLASRGVLADLSQYDCFAEVKGRFQENAFTHYSYNGGIYGIPLTQSFPMLFYRTDVLSGLGINSPPETWNDLINMLPSIQRNYMSVGLVLPSANISPATESGHTFALLTLQNGSGYYNDDFTESALGSAESVRLFEKWTDFYTDYTFPQSFDSFTRFRTGEFPLIIANYSFAGQLESAASEINGLWDFCPVPGTLRNDSTVSHAANSNSSGAVIFENSEKKEQSWEFLKWFTSDEIQAQYGRRTESILGAVGRYEAANINAMNRLSWSAHQLRRLGAQRDELEEIPIIPPSYAVTRNIMNAFRETVNGGKNPRDTLIWYNNDINSELKRKNSNLR